MTPPTSKRYVENQRLSIAGEARAANFLVNLGYRILARRYRNKFGEIDLVAQKAKRIAFVEVKTRSQDHFGDPLESITAWKLRSIFRASRVFLAQWPGAAALEVEYLGIGIQTGGESPGVDCVSLFPD